MVIFSVEKILNIQRANCNVREQNWFVLTPVGRAELPVKVQSIEGGIGVIPAGDTMNAII